MLSPINGYEGLYSITENGEVYSHSRQGTFSGYKTPQLDIDGYPCVHLYKNNKVKVYKIHKLVALNFVYGYIPGLVVNHIDEIKTNNHYTNLEWVTSKYNSQYSNSKTYIVTFPDGTEKKVVNLTKFCRKYGLTNSNLFGVVVGKRAHHKGFKARLRHG